MCPGLQPLSDCSGTRGKCLEARRHQVTESGLLVRTLPALQGLFLSWSWPFNPGRWQYTSLLSCSSVANKLLIDWRSHPRLWWRRRSFCICVAEDGSREHCVLQAKDDHEVFAGERHNTADADPGVLSGAGSWHQGSLVINALFHYFRCLPAHNISFGEGSWAPQVKEHG